MNLLPDTTRKAHQIHRALVDLAEAEGHQVMAVTVAATLAGLTSPSKMERDRAKAQVREWGRISHAKSE